MTVYVDKKQLYLLSLRIQFALNFNSVNIFLIYFVHVVHLADAGLVPTLIYGIYLSKFENESCHFLANIKLTV